MRGNGELKNIVELLPVAALDDLKNVPNKAHAHIPTVPRLAKPNEHGAFKPP